MTLRSTTRALDVVSTGDATIVRLTDEDFHGGQHQRLLALTDTTGLTHLCLDFANVRFLGSIGMATLIQLDRKMRAAGGRLTLVNVPPVEIGTTY